MVLELMANLRPKGEWLGLRRIWLADDFNPLT